MLQKVVIIGPESTGKSTLCQQLAKHYQTYCCPEFARQYLTEHGSRYTYNDLLTIAEGQISLEDDYIQKAAIENKKFLFIDTDMYVMKIWCEFVFKKCHSYILQQIIDRKYELFLLCNPDLPWVPDPLREYPDLERREKLYKMYKDILVNQSVPWTDIRGETKQRLKTAITAVEQLVSK